ncbi:hypothetical protein [Candidatus Methylobacter oryzae]|uniref:Peptidase S8/S53 domain-containing protein n=1 Tax=Candidatus Methylobacter oryzae TaxID=2497749 RepID=A0ABY3C466_9GAMM|nr:hypothetical protein [Candidatus Methylobacter oryzae]TRW89494.1 hypothetical protein EKO24_020730 [Candidatus Methylobacter oryzae]
MDCRYPDHRDVIWALQFPASRQLLQALLSHMEVVAAIAPCNLAAFPPFLEVNAAYAWSSFLPTSCILAVVDSGINPFGTDLDSPE